MVVQVEQNRANQYAIFNVVYVFKKRWSDASGEQDCLKFYTTVLTVLDVLYNSCITNTLQDETQLPVNFAQHRLCAITEIKVIIKESKFKFYKISS